MWNYWEELKRKATGVVPGPEEGCPDVISWPCRGDAVQERYLKMRAGMRLTSLALEILYFK